MAGVPRVPRVQHQSGNRYGHGLVIRFGIGDLPYALAEERDGRPADGRENRHHGHDDQQLTHTGQGRSVESAMKNVPVQVRVRLCRGPVREYDNLQKL